MELLTVLGASLATVLAIAWYYAIAIAGLILAAIVFSNDDEVGMETFVFLGLLGLIVWNMWGLITIGEGLMSIVYYLVIGTLWSILNYYRVIKNHISEAREHNRDPGLEYFLGVIPKHRIIRWIAYWPFSILNFAIADLIVGIVTWIADRLGNTYSRITRRVYNNIMGK